MQRAKISQLPEDVRAELETRLVRQGFADYDQLAEWLAGQGYEISRSSVHRYGQQFERRLSALKAATEQAKAVTAAAADDEGDMNEALIRLVQTRVFELLVEIEADDKDLAKIGRMVADLARASVNQKKWAAQVKDRINAKLDSLTSETGKKGGLTPDMADEIRREILGVL